MWAFKIADTTYQMLLLVLECLSRFFGYFVMQIRRIFDFGKISGWVNCLIWMICVILVFWMNNRRFLFKILEINFTWNWISKKIRQEPNTSTQNNRRWRHLFPFKKLQKYFFKQITYMLPSRLFLNIFTTVYNLEFVIIFMKGVDLRPFFTIYLFKSHGKN